MMETFRAELHAFDHEPGDRFQIVRLICPSLLGYHNRFLWSIGYFEGLIQVRDIDISNETPK